MEEWNKQSEIITDGGKIIEYDAMGREIFWYKDNRNI